jgi:hypothetical protein
MLQKKITFITRYYPPSPNINGESVCDMVAFLQEHYNIESNIITLKRDFEGGGGSKREAVGNVIMLNTLFTSNSKIKRFLTFLYDGFVLTREALKYKNSLIIVTTSPPLLPMWAALMFSSKTKWAFWSLDLFPEGFMVTDIIKESNLFYKWVLKKTYSSSPSHLITLGPKQSEHLNKQFGKNIDSSILPCGVFFYQDKNISKPDWYQEDKIILGYCGNVHDPHNPDFIKAVIDNLDPKRHLLILALYGTKAPALKDYAKHKMGIILVENVPRNQLHFIDIHMVSLTKKWTHIAVPSKAVSAVSMGCPILFCGSQESDNWHLLKEAAWFIDENENMQETTKLFLSSIEKNQILDKKENAKIIYESLKKNVLDTYDKIAKLSQS